MKQRTFLQTLALFLVSINLGILLFSIYSYRSITGQASEKCLSEHYMIVSMLAKDMASLEGRDVTIDSSLDALFQPYQYLTTNGGLFFTKDGNPLYSSGSETGLLSSDISRLEESRLVAFTEASDHNYVVISGWLPTPFETYGLQYYADITETVSIWRTMSNTFFGAGLLISCVLAFILLLLLGRLFHPLNQISRISADIAAGDYSTRLPENGKDELAKMGRSFNHMADQVQRQITELQDTAEKKQMFVDSFAHELRTPLTAIYGHAEYLQKTSPSEEYRLSALEYIMSESRRLQQMAYQLLDLSNLRRDQIRMQPLRLGEVIKKAARTIESKIHKRNIQLNVMLTPEGVYGDEMLLESLFLNLLDNAIHACEKGGHISIESLKQGKHLTVSIHDNGKGIPEKALQSIAEPFYRVDRARSRMRGGAGLGLAICKQIAERHNAILSFSSEQGVGTTATVTFTTPQ